MFKVADSSYAAHGMGGPIVATDRKSYCRSRQFMVEQIQRVVVRAYQGQVAGPHLLFSLALTTGVLLILGVGGSIVADGQLPHALSTMVSMSLMAGIVVANTVQIVWEATHG